MLVNFQKVNSMMTLSTLTALIIESMNISRDSVFIFPISSVA